MKKTLVIVQDVPTQFDAPLYNQIKSKEAFEVFVLYTQAIDKDSEIGRKPEWDHIGAHLYQHHFLDRKQRKSVKYCLSRILEHQPEHVIVSGYTPKLHRDILAKLRRMNVSVGLRSDNTIRHSKLSGVRGFIKKVYLRRFLTLYSHWHPVGEQAADYLKLLSAEERPISYFSYNVDTQWFKQQSDLSRKHRASRLAEIGFAQDNYIVLGIMKWSEREDPLSLIAAFAKMRQSEPLLRLVLIGDGPLKDEVLQAAQKLGDAVCLPGYVNYSSLPSWYSLADVFVHPAPQEPWGVSVAEAMSSGVPVIASNGVGAGAELIAEGFNGLVFEKNDVGSLVAALQKWLMLKKTIDDIELRERCYESVQAWTYKTTINNFNLLLDKHGTQPLLVNND